MRTKSSLDGSNGRATERVAMSAVPSMPMEWLDTGTWRLPSGKALAEFALQAGFLAPLLFKTEGIGKVAQKTGGSLGDPALTVRAKNLGKGSER